jgi:hypothetical protein
MDEAIIAILELILNCFDSVVSWFSNFFIDKFNLFFEHAESSGTVVLNRLFTFCSSLEYSDFLALYVGFVFIFFAFNKALQIIRG